MYNSRSLSKLYKAKTDIKKSGLINEKKKQVSPSNGLTAETVERGLD